jgi:hypothetical protein
MQSFSFDQCAIGDTTAELCATRIMGPSIEFIVVDVSVDNQFLIVVCAILFALLFGYFYFF